MIYNKSEMFDMLLDYTMLEADTLDLILKVAGDTNQTYVKILKYLTGYNTFLELEEKGTKIETMYDLDDEEEVI